MTNEGEEGREDEIEIEYRSRRREGDKHTESKRTPRERPRCSAPGSSSLGRGWGFGQKSSAAEKGNCSNCRVTSFHADLFTPVPAAPAAPAGAGDERGDDAASAAAGATVAVAVAVPLAMKLLGLPPLWGGPAVGHAMKGFSASIGIETLRC